MTDLVWTSPAFLVLELMPQQVAFGIVRQVDYLQEFPKMGSTLIRSSSISNYRQLIYRRKFRIIYEFDEHAGCVYVLHLQHCRQKLPATRELKQARGGGGELPLE